MSDFKLEVLPSGVLIRKIAGEDNTFVLSDGGQALIVTAQDIARMSGIARPEKVHGSCRVVSNLSSACPHKRRANTSDTTAKCLDCGLTYIGQWYNSPSNKKK